MRCTPSGGKTLNYSTLYQQTERQIIRHQRGIQGQKVRDHDTFRDGGYEPTVCQRSNRARGMRTYEDDFGQHPLRPAVSKEALDILHSMKGNEAGLLFVEPTDITAMTTKDVEDSASWCWKATVAQLDAAIAHESASIAQVTWTTTAEGKRMRSSVNGTGGRRHMIKLLQKCKERRIKLDE